MSFENYEDIRVIRKEGQNCGFDPPLTKNIYEELVSSLWINAYFESWVKLLRPLHSTLKALR